jgi:hypothetical protein
MPSTSTTSNTKRPSIFSRLSSSASSMRSNSSTSSSSALNPKDQSQTNRYAKACPAFDFSISYPYSTSKASSVTAPASTVSSDSETDGENEADMATAKSSSKTTLRYAKDGKGHDFSSTYKHTPANYAMTLGPGGIGGTYIVSTVPRGKSRVVAGEAKMRYGWHAGRQGA